MTLSLRPETEQWIREQVEAGRYPSAEAMVEAALLDQMAYPMDDTLDEEDIAAINEADAECDRGEGIDFEEYRAQFAKRLQAELS